MSRIEGAVESVRRANLSRVLRLVHEDGPVSRAALTDATGLNRSTVGALVGELVTAGLVEETAADPSRRVGRPSPNVVASPMVVAIAVNPEVDALTIAAVGLDRSIVARSRIDLTELLSPQRTVELVVEQLSVWRSNELREHTIVGIGAAVPGLVSSPGGLVRRAPHLDWNDVPLSDALSEASGLPTTIDNDATLGALAESLYGAGREVRDVVYLNGGSSGIGGGLIIAGQLVRGAGGYAGELGQNRPGIASSDDRLAGPGGTVEDEVSRARLLATVGLPAADEPTLAAAIRSSRAAVVVTEVTRQRRILATALANAVNVLNPSVVILGGFLATLLEHDDEALLQEVAAQAMPMNSEDLSIRVAALGEDRLLVGAAEIAFDELLNDPLR